MDRLLNVLAVFSLVLIAWVLVSVRRAHIRVEHSVSWFIAGGVLFLLSRWQRLDELLASALGTSDIFLTLLAVSGATFLIVLYRQSLRISSLKDSNIKMAQKIAILEYRCTYGTQDSGE